MNQFKLSTKIFGGFISILLLLAIVGGFSVYAVKTLDKEIEILSRAEALRESMLQSRRREKDFMLHHDDESRDKLTQAAQQAQQSCDELIGLLRHEEDVERTRIVKKQFTEYEHAFYQYVDTVAIREESEKQISFEASVAIKNADIAKKVQEGKLLTNINDGLSTEKLKDRAEKVLKYNRMMELILLCRSSEKYFIIREDKKHLNTLDERVSELLAISQQTKLSHTKPDDRQRTDDIINAVQKYHESFQAYVIAYDNGKIAAQHMVDAANAVLEQITLLLEQAHADITHTKESMLGIIIGIVLAGVVFGCLLAFLITQGITRPINRIMDDLAGSTDQTASSAGEISSASQQLSQGATEQAASLEETSSSLDEMSSMTRQNADNATKANQMAQSARTAAETGNEAMREMQNAMVNINDSSDQISKIIKTIEEIAFQTNLLALNAAVEAARAGEHGKGFAVVADEVRNLAQRAAGGARDTAELIEDSINKVKDGSTIASKVGDSLGDIMGNTQKVADVIGEIAAASREQAEGIGQVTSAVGQIDQVTQGNAAAAEECAASSEELLSQAETLKGVVAELQHLIHGRNGEPRTSVPSRTVKTDRRTKRPDAKSDVPKQLKETTVIKPEEMIPFDDF